MQKKTSMSIPPKKLSTESPCNPAILLLSIYLKELKAGLIPIFVHQCSSSISHNSQKMETIQVANRYSE